MKTIVFVGPTLGITEAKTILDADYRAPARQGDILSACSNERADLIGIIDGAIDLGPSVWHKEILHALSLGVTVWGAGALGAIRAVELQSQGMRGVGSVFHSFLDGRYEEDDEVYSAYEQCRSGFQRLSEPMVNIRASLHLAWKQGLIDAPMLDRMIALAKSIYYSERTLERIFEVFSEHGIPSQQLQDLQHFMEDHYVDVLKEDALELLHAMRKSPGIRTGSRIPAEHGPYFQAFYHRDRVVAHQGTEVRLSSISDYVTANEPDIDEINFRTYNRRLALVLADLLEVSADQTEIEQETRRFRRKHSLEDEQALPAWLDRNDLSMEEFNELMEETARIVKVQRWYLASQRSMSNTKVLLDELRLMNRYEESKTRVANLEQLVQDKGEEVNQIWNEDSAESLIRHHLRNTPGVNRGSNLFEVVSGLKLNPNLLRLELAKNKVAHQTAERFARSLFAE